MRVIFDEELKAVADDLDRMVQDVRKAINGAGDALLKQDVEAAQCVIAGDIEIDALESSVIDQCIRLPAKQIGYKRTGVGEMRFGGNQYNILFLFYRPYTLNSAHRRRRISYYNIFGL